MDDEEQEHEPKIGLVEIILVAFLIFIFGIADIFLPIIGTIFDWAFTQIYLRMKGMSGSYQVWMAAANSVSTVDSVVPGTDLLDPFIDTGMFLWIAYMDNHPSQLTAALEEAAGVVAKLEGDETSLETETAASGTGTTAGTSKAENTAALEREKGTGAAVSNRTEEMPDRKPSEVPSGSEEGATERRRPQGQEGGGGQEESEESGAENPEEIERRNREEGMAKFFKQGAEVTPGEEMMEEDISNPKEIQFNEGKGAMERRRMEQGLPQEEQEQGEGEENHRKAA